ncbi:putative ABC transport system permease protein [Catalinimonas alkaloidigena]|uniref:Putative ABC transport system permease protein n=1 Tax=Catalinimonas alkaloidigena TaxID=1075417 RepID=A0A1G9TYR2_9BACT|nr:ABC transporter permease [Catalinimonas alkaloidigena]SDM52920.1 putative ABC transport system permease protein [Catalinimonas alkaloidigena]
MLKNYLKIAYRSLLHQKVYAGINLLGLAIGMACCLLIFQYVTFEKSFDTFHQHESTLYRILQGYARNGEALDFSGAYTAQALAPALKEEVPELVAVTRLHADRVMVANAAQPNQVFEEDEVLYADPDFLQMFSFPLLTGDKKHALEPGTALLSRQAAQKYFGQVNPLGEVLEVTGQVSQAYRVVGVFEDVPLHSHLQFELLLSIQDLLNGEDYRNEPEGGWSWNNFSTYVQLQPSAEAVLTEQKMTEVYLNVRSDLLQQQGFTAALHLQPLQDIHLNAAVTGPSDEVIGDSRTVYFFTIIGLITLCIALVNYINLATARALNRAREVGVRKVIGAQRGQLMVQFLCESALTNLTAAVLAVTLAAWLTPLVNQLAQTQLSSSLWMSSGFWPALLLTLLIGTVLAGLYPAFVLSSFKPTAVLKGNVGSFSSPFWLRRGLVVLQFTASIVLVVGTVIIYHQLRYMRSLALGLNLEQVLTVEGPRILPEGTDRATATATFLQQLRSLPAVTQAAASSTLPGQGFNWNGAAIRKVTQDPAQAIRGVATYIDTSFARLYKLTLVAGQGFEDITLSEAEDAPWTVMTNEKTVQSLGFASPEDAVGQVLDIGGYTAQIIGVYQDFRWSSAHGEQQNIVFGPTRQGNHLSLRVTTQDLPETIRQIESVYHQLFPRNVFHYQFVDEAFDQQYTNDVRFARLFSVFAGLAIFIACLGLFGLVAFTSQQRKKEIGIRKILSASVEHVVALLSKDFILLVFIGFIVAIPIAWYSMQLWLDNFVYRIQMGVEVFLLAGAGAGLIALATVSWQAVKAALANPVDSLREE